MRGQTSFPYKCLSPMKLRLFAGALLLFCSAVSGVRAATIAVTTTNDSGSGSLRDALASASDGDTIDASGVSGTILLTNGELLVTNSISILGPGRSLAVDGNAASRVFHIGAGVTVTITSLTITNGSGGVYNDHATLTLSNSTVSGNSARCGGGILNDGSNGNATLQVHNCTLIGNSTDIECVGGGIYNNGDSGIAMTELVNSTLNGNVSCAGGGIFSDGYGGTGLVRIINCTFSDNSSPCGNANSIESEGAMVEIGNTILKAGPGGENISMLDAALTSLGYNLSDDDGGGFLTATGDQTNTNPMLGPLQDNGGPTFTHALLPGSPAIDAGDPNATSPPDFDQRGPGFPRVVNGRIDIGAFEYTPDLLITAAERIGDDFRLTFSVALLGKNYEIQTQTNLDPGAWASLPGSIPGNGASVQTTITNAFSQPHRFYRVHQLP
jgi:hypothetical protein